MTCALFQVSIKAVLASNVSILTSAQMALIFAYLTTIVTTSIITFINVAKRAGKKIAIVHFR